MSVLPLFPCKHRKLQFGKMGGTCRGGNRSKKCVLCMCRRVRTSRTSNQQWQINSKSSGKCVFTPSSSSAGMHLLLNGSRGQHPCIYAFHGTLQKTLSTSDLVEETAVFHLFLCKVLFSKCDCYFSKMKVRNGCSFLQGLNLD